MASNSQESPTSVDVAAVEAYRRSDQPSDITAYHTDPQCPAGQRITAPVMVDPADDRFELCEFCADEGWKASHADFSVQRTLRDLEPDDVPTLSDSGEVP